MLRLTTAFLALVLASGCAPTTAFVELPPGPPAQRPEWKTGYQWVYVSTVTAKRDPDVTTVLGEKEFRGVACWELSEGATERAYVTKETLSLRGRMLTAGRLLTLADPDQLTYRWPLEVGKRWSGRWATRDGSQDSAEVRVVAYELIKVPAGEFKAYHVVHRLGNGYLREYWFAPEVRYLAKLRLHQSDGSIVDYDLQRYRLD